MPYWKNATRMPTVSAPLTIWKPPQASIAASASMLSHSTMG